MVIFRHMTVVYILTRFLSGPTLLELSTNFVLLSLC